jgi:negative regulator of flagellin synthesis FlgM
MKISDTPQTVPITAPAAAKPVVPSSTGGGDKVSQAQSEQLAQSVAVAQEAAGTANTSRLQKLTEAVRNGSYRPDPDQIAESILDDAEVDARLQAALQR